MIHQLSHKLRAQITRFSGKLSQGLSKPNCRFIDEMMYAFIMAMLTFNMIFLS